LPFCPDFEDDGEDESDGGWQQELQRRYAQDANFMAELRARHPTSPPENHPSQNYNHHQYPALNHHHPNQGYMAQQNYPNYNQAEPNQSPFGPQVGGSFR
jgi:hypothetical protein